MKDKEVNGQIKTIANKVERKEDVAYGAGMASFHSLLPSTSSIPITKIDATHRGQIEAHNEDKSRTTKDTLNEIKRIHYKEKKETEENNMESYQPGMDSDGLVSKTFDFLRAFHLYPKTIVI